MEIQFAIVRSENREYLCYKAGEAYVDASNPMIAFAAGEDEFEIVEPDSSFRQKEYEFRLPEANSIASYQSFTAMVGWLSPW